VEVIAAVAIGLNPYVGAFVLAAFAAFTGRLSGGEFAALVPVGLLTAATFVSGAAAPLDFVLSKFVRFAPHVRRCSQIVAPAAGGFFAAFVSDGALPLPLVAAGGALLSWLVATMLTSIAARASRSPAWVGLGHIPVFMSAATAAACIIPLGLAKPAIGYGLVAATLSVLLWSVFAAMRTAQGTAVARTAGSLVRPNRLGVR
jgi:hypothetical protein